MKLYDKIKKLLIENPDYRSSDQRLMWRVWEDEGCATEVMSKHSFLGATTPESITRARRMIQQNHPELQATKRVQNYRKDIQNQKGTHVYRVAIFNNEENKVTFQER